MQSYAACRDPEIQAHVRARFGDAGRARSPSCPAPRPTRCGSSSPHGMLLNVIAALDLERSPSEAWAASVEPAWSRLADALRSSAARRLRRWRRRVLASCRRCVAGAVGGPVVGLLDSDDDFDDPARRRCCARRDRRARPARSAAPDLIALVRLGAPADSRAGAGEARARRPRRCATPTSRDVVAYERGGDRAARLARRALDLPARDLPHRRRRRRAGRALQDARSSASRA